ncbi:MAG: hypothetical protein AAGG51_08225 [Cyanobacteria bacterium P01_G01_bin.54]
MARNLVNNSVEQQWQSRKFGQHDGFSHSKGGNPEGLCGIDAIARYKEKGAIAWHWSILQLV